MKRLMVIVLAVFSAGAFTACGGKKTEQFNLLVITLDTTRADGIGAYGNRDASTPHIDRLAENGIMFQNCYTAVPLTLPAHCSLFTGRYPLAHKVRNNGTYYLPEAETTLAEILKENGFRTFAFIASFTLLAKFGLDQGFDFYDETFRQKQMISNYHDEIAADEITKKFAAWLEKNHEKKFFTWLHFFDPHSPYQLHSEVDTKFSQSERLKYEGEIAYVDMHVGKILRLLEAKKILERTVIVIVGDHGEAFGEHKEFGHGIFCYEESLKVPLILYNPVLFAKSRKINSRVNLVDVLPSILHYFKIASPETVQGKSFHNLAAGEKEKRQRDVYFESRFGMETNNWAPITGMVVDDHKYISLIEPELYDLGQDAAERINLYKAKNILAKKMDERLRQFIIDYSSAAKAGKRKLSQDDFASLKTLGYISAASAKAKEMIDPKKGFVLYAQVESLKEKAKAGKYLEAQAELEQIILSNPGVQLPNFFELEFTIKKNTGRIAEACATLQKAITIFPDHEAFKMVLALELVSQNEHARAKELCREILNKNSRFAAAFILLGDISRKQNKRAEAVENYRQALEIEPQNTRLKAVLSELEKGMGDLQRGFPAAAESKNDGRDLPDAGRIEAMAKEALALIADQRLDQARGILEKILRLDPDNVDALVNIGTVDYRSGEFAPALKHYQRASEINPAHALAFSNMGMVYFSQFQRDNDRSFLELALKHFNKSIQLDANLSDGYSGRGAVFLVLNESKKAVLDFKKVIQLNPESVDAYFNITYALIKAGRKKEAMDILQRFKKSFYEKLNPQDQNELNLLISEINSPLS
jgi:arylsulfatase A-like enzyme/Tfp pilus assembly protein PilF